ncbi:MgtC/SapB family protein [Plantactinospora sp. KBS50]|uniref:MgtC/SapB family protein n=1 Tax=Plantactinospora sp. KBS50 TaxID=2024580 RepID=UPI000BAB2236|nr:MgtC/SapB family protein [Plantactinospora sp. KBS50]ASW54453.1 magnesium transporter MgtC [Plantactinospora sp. KBS50]
MALADTQGWPQLGELGLALLLSAVIGLEREIRQKSAGLRTHTLVGFAAALIMQVSKYGFADVFGEHVVLDPSRVAAQIVSGIGFIGGGLIFVRRDAVRGLTTAAVIWLTAAIGMAAGSGLWLLAVAATAGHLIVVFALTPLSARLPRSKYAPWRLRLTYLDGRGVLRDALTACTARGFTVNELYVDQPRPERDPPAVTVWLTLTGGRDLAPLTAALTELDGVLTVAGDDAAGGAA